VHHAGRAVVGAVAQPTGCSCASPSVAGLPASTFGDCSAKRGADDVGPTVELA
jgi:hypothetical protein